MLKMLGVILIVFAGTMIGFYQAAQYATRPRQIRQLIHALQHLETQIMYGFIPLPDALVQMSRQLSEPLAAMFRQVVERLSLRHGMTTRECWHQAIEEYWKRTSMKSNEKETIMQLGFTLGITDREDQIKHLRLAMSELQGEEHTSMEEQRRYEKMWKSLGVLTGVLVVILIY